MKRKWWIMTVLAAALMLLCCGAATADQHGSCGNNVVWSFNSSTCVLNISGTGAMADYASQGSPWYSFRMDISIINVGSGVTRIGKFAFQDCSRAMIVTMKDSVTEIGHGAFQGCTWLTTVTLKEGLLTIEPYAFSDCWDLINVNIPASVASIGSLAFENCDDLVAVTVNNPQCEIGDAAHDVFNGCRQVLVLFGHPHSTAETYAAAADIRFGPLYGSCGDNVTFAFDSVSGKMKISGTGPMTDFESFYDSIPKYAPWSDYTDNITSVSIDSGVTGIGWRAFRYCVNLSSVNIPSSVISIGPYSFEQCTNLTSITIPANVTSIGEKAFFNCNSLASVIINNPNTTIDGYDAFANCAASLVIRGLEDSTAHAYANNNNITFLAMHDATFFLPAALTKTDSESFLGISAKGVVIPKNMTEITGNPFEGSSLTTVYGYPGSAAETFASTYDYFFIAIDDAWMAAH